MGTLGVPFHLFLLFLVLSSSLPLLCLTDDLNSIEHIVIFMQENRAFDHYFGTLRGVRGFNDRTTITLPTGKSVWYQPVNSTYEQLPWHMDSSTTSGMCVDAPEMDYFVDIAMWHEGFFDRWNSARDPAFGMSHFTRSDLPYYHALADTFTICDQYFQSTLTQTNPNRLHLFTGSNGLSVGQTPVLDNTEPTEGFSWVTYAELLQQAGVSWRVYQEEDNFDDNALEWFASFKRAQPGSPLYDRGVAVVPDLVDAFRSDLAADTLPQVSWIVAPEALSEHASNRPPFGEDLSARLLHVLGTANPAVYAKTAFFLNYDEQGGWYDHVPQPTPPVRTGGGDGLSTVTVEGENNHGMPIGLGFRVPMTVVSPWTRGGYVSSQVFDHTSVLQFVERRFGVHCPNISPWRRSVCGDLTSVFDFDHPDYSWPALPDTSQYINQTLRECATLPLPRVPLHQVLPVQETGTRPSRALPYECHTDGWVELTTTASGAKATTLRFVLNVINTGKHTFVANVYDVVHPELNIPRHYTVEPDKNVTDYWTLTASTASYGFALYGPNGYHRTFAGDASVLSPSSAHLEVSMRYAFIAEAIRPLASAVSSFKWIPKLDGYQGTTQVVLNLNNTQGAEACDVVITANAYYNSKGPWKLTVGSREVLAWQWDVTDSANWYDFSVTLPLVDASYQRRFMGRVENGLPLTSDPAMAG